MKDKEKKEKTKIGLKDIDDNELKVALKKTNEHLKKLDTALSEIENTLKRSDAQTRLFLTDALMGFIINASELGPIITGGLLSKFKAISMPYVVFKPTESKEVPNYTG